MTKNEIRKVVTRAVLELSAEERLVADAHIASQLLGLPEWSGASVVFGYVPMEDEVDVSPILSTVLRAGKGLALPRVEGGVMFFHLVSDTTGSIRNWFDLVSTLERHSLGFLQPPTAVTSVVPQVGDIVLVPGRAFDRSGNRLGRGGGYYDTFLSSLSGDVFNVGIAYDVQMQRSVPQRENDERVQIVITERETVFCRRAFID